MPIEPSHASRYFIGGLGRTLTSDDLRQHFETFGPLTEARVQLNAARQSLGYGWLTFQIPVPNLAEQEHVVQGCKVNVEVAKGETQRGGAQGSQHPHPSKHQQQLQQQQQQQGGSYRPGGSGTPPPMGNGGMPGGRHMAPPPPPSSGSGYHDRRRKRSRSSSSSRSSRSSRGSSAESRGRRHRRSSRGRPVVLPQLPVPGDVAPPPPPPMVGGRGVTMVCVPYNLCPPDMVRDPRCCVGQYYPEQQVVQVTSPPMAMEAPPPNGSGMAVGYGGRMVPRS